MPYLKRVLAAFITMSVVAVALPSCNDVDKVTAAFNQAITTIDTQSSQWRQALPDLESKLVSDGQTTLANEVANLLNASIANVGDEFRCDVDFIGVRVKGTLQNILDKFHGLPPKPADPRLCKVIPNAIDLNLVQQGRLNIIEFHGYDLTPSGIKFSFTVGQAAEQPIPDTYVANPAPYTMTFNVAPTNGFRFPVGATKVDIRVNGAFFSSMSVIAPPPTPVAKTETGDFIVSYYQPGGNISSQCSNVSSALSAIYTVPSGWKLDRSKGDAAHAGISQIAVNDNQQSAGSLTAYNYFARDDLHLQVEGQVCSAGGWGAGAIFQRTYRAFLIQASG